MVWVFVRNWSGKGPDWEFRSGFLLEICFDSNVELFVKMLRQCAQLFDFEALASLGFQFVSCAFKCK